MIGGIVDCRDTLHELCAEPFFHVPPSEVQLKSQPLQTAHLLLLRLDLLCESLVALLKRGDDDGVLQWEWRVVGKKPSLTPV